MLAAVHNLAIALAVLAAAMMANAVTGFGFGETEVARSFVAMAVFTGFVAGGAFFATRRPTAVAGRSAKFLFVVLIWIVLPVFAAVPMATSADGFMPALFEAISGLTTTGASVFEGVGALSRTIVLWRAQLHWLGGFLTLSLIVVVLAPGGIGGIPSRQSIFRRLPISGQGGRQWVLIRDVLIGYVGLTFIAATSLSIADVGAFDAICLAMSAISTGGFMPIDGGLAAYDSGLVETIMMVTMLIGATSILWHRMILRGRWAALSEHRESYWLIGLFLVVGLAFAFSMMDEFGYGFGRALHRGLTTGASLVSTSGIDVEAGGFQMLPLPVVLLVALVGGGAFSTAGGLRLFRVGGMLVESIKETRRLIYPHGISPRPFGAQEFDIGTMKAVWSLFSATLALLAVAVAAIALTGVDFGGAMAATVSAFSNIGGIYSSDWAEAVNWPGFVDLPIGAQLLLGFVMIVGRIEIIGIIIAISMMVWRS
ncbi:MAG: potassium transporter TrkG [Alphaproteobacteria bacterium]